MSKPQTKVLNERESWGGRVVRKQVGQGGEGSLKAAIPGDVFISSSGSKGRPRGAGKCLRVPDNNYRLSLTSMQLWSMCWKVSNMQRP